MAMPKWVLVTVTAVFSGSVGGWITWAVGHHAPCSQAMTALEFGQVGAAIEIYERKTGTPLPDLRDVLKTEFVDDIRRDLANGETWSCDIGGGGWPLAQASLRCRGTEGDGTPVKWQATFEGIWVGENSLTSDWGGWVLVDTEEQDGTSSGGAQLNKLKQWGEAAGKKVRQAYDKLRKR